jgi:hypothetical protein
VSIVQDIQAAVPHLSQAELEELRTWFEDYLEDRLELSDEVTSKLDQSRREIVEGEYTTRLRE